MPLMHSMNWKQPCGVEWLVAVRKVPWEGKYKRRPGRSTLIIFIFMEKSKHFYAIWYSNSCILLSVKATLHKYCNIPLLISISMQVIYIIKFKKLIGSIKSHNNELYVIQNKNFFCLHSNRIIIQEQTTEKKSFRFRFNNISPSIEFLFSLFFSCGLLIRSLFYWTHLSWLKVSTDLDVWLKKTTTKI